MLSDVGSDFQEFLAAVSVLTMPTPDDARKQFEIRAEAVREELSQRDSEERKAATYPGSLLLEDVYRTAVVEAEVVGDLGPRNLVADVSPRRVPGESFCKFKRRTSTIREPHGLEETLNVRSPFRPCRRAVPYLSYFARHHICRPKQDAFFAACAGLRACARLLYVGG